MNLFKRTTSEGGEIKPGQKNVEIRWDFDTLKKEDIATYEEDGETKYCIKPGCGCTADISVDENGITAYYNDRGNTKGQVNKSITVYYKTEGEKPRIKNQNGDLVFNRKQGLTVLFFNVIVK